MVLGQISRSGDPVQWNTLGMGGGGGGGGRCPAPEKGCLLMFAAFERIVNIVILVL